MTTALPAVGLRDTKIEIAGQQSLNIFLISTVLSKVLFARFRIVEHILTIISFLCEVINCQRKNERENDLFTPLLVHFVSNTLCLHLQHILVPTIES